MSSAVTLQLTGVGIQDTYLTVNPEINVFKYRYYRYFNFATETTKIDLSDISDFGKRFFATIPFRGHLLSNLFLKIKLPPLVKKDGTFASWTNGMGYAILDWIELEINGIVFEKISGHFLDMYDELTVSNTDYGKRNMILKSDSYFASRFNATKPVELIVPLSFWFTKQPNLALPLHLFTKTTTIKVNFKLRKFDELVHYDGLVPPDQVSISDIELFGDFIYFDDTILENLKSEQYIISQVQIHERELIGSGVDSYLSELRFNHPVSELIFAFVEKDSIENNDLFNYSDRTIEGPLVDSIGLVIDGRERFEMLPESYYRLALPRIVHSYVPSKCVYCMPFSNRPEYNQPTGSLNFSRFDSINLKVSRKTIGKLMYLYLFAVNYNVMTVQNGSPVLEFGV